jgi:hypothetical protein
MNHIPDAGRKVEVMNAKELAQIINGRSYTNELTKEEESIAKAAGLVVAFGGSDDLLELRGAVSEEVGAWQGQTVRFTKAGLLVNDCDNDECPHFEKLKAAATPLEIVWHDEGGGPCWTFKTAIPHATFELSDDNEPFCRGVVFALADIPE